MFKKRLKKMSEKKKITLEEYREKQIQKLELPSGFVIEVRNIMPYTLMKIHEELNIKLDSDEIYSAVVIEKLFERFIINPKMKVSDFDREDYIFLHELIFEKVTLPEKEKE